MRVLITGVSGFAGSHLAEFLLSGSHEVFGYTDDPSLDGNLAEIGDRLRVVKGDVRDRASVRATLAEVKPERIYHLAAVTPGREVAVPRARGGAPGAEGGGSGASGTQGPGAKGGGSGAKRGAKGGRGTAGDTPADAGSRARENAFWEVNVGGTAVLLDEASRLPDVRVLVAGSSAEYGLVPTDLNPIDETAELKPVGLYAVSKIGQDLLAFSYWAQQGVWVVRTRGFNHTGPREDTGFVCSTFARQIAEAELGRGPKVIRVGNLNAYRDIGDVRDIVRGYVAALEKGRPGGLYNVCSGSATQIREVLDRLVAMSTAPLEVELDEARLRPSDLPYQCGDYSLLEKETGWRPTIPLDKTLQDLLDYWRLRLREDTS